MTDSYIQQPNDGSGKKAQTFNATVSGQSVHAQGVVLVDKSTQANGVSVDSRGGLYARFVEGSPVFDAFNKLKTVQSRIIGLYEHSVDSYDDLFYVEETGGGASTFDQDTSSVVLSVTGANGDACVRTTNRYHHYQLGNAQLIKLTGSYGDTGKLNNTRRMGYYDDDNGVFIELQGTVFNVVLRTSVGGTMAETRVAQAAWNVDRLDGSAGEYNKSGLTLDVTGFRLWWFDLAWLGAGVVRMGTYTADGQRVVCHIFANSSPYAWAQRCTLPIRFENVNTGLTSGTSELREGAALVCSEGDFDYTFWRNADAECASKVVVTDVPLVCLRSKAILDNGNSNHVNAYPERVSLYVTGDPIELCISQFDLAALTGASFVNGASSLQIDNSATAVNTAHASYWEQHCFMCPVGVTNIDLQPFFELNDEGILLGADGVTQSVLALVASRLGSSATTVTATVTYRELY